MKTICPLLKKECVETGCKFWVHMLGEDPQSGKPIDSFNCAISWIPILMVEVSRQQRSTNAAVESSRNETCNMLKIGFVAMAKSLSAREVLEDKSNGG